MTQNASNEPHVTIIGSGVGGLCMAMRLIHAGHTNFEIVEKADDIGGTWRDNTYPGCACDVPSHFYSYSFEPRSDWSRTFPARSEIYSYLSSLVEKYKLKAKTRFNSEIESTKFDETSQKWQLFTKSGETLETDIVVTALGQLNRPKVPSIDGQDSFSGAIFHSAEWRHDVSLEGKRVAVIGNGPSAAQFIPEVAKVAGELTVFQRSPCHVVPRNDEPYSALQKAMFKYIPGYRRFVRGLIYWSLESNFTAFNDIKKTRFLIKALNFSGTITDQVKEHFDEQVTDPHLREILWPDYEIGCKRVVISDDYYPALHRDNVRVETKGIQQITSSGIDTVDGTAHEFDVIIYGTGFASTDFLAPLEVTGTQNTELNTAWKDGAEAYLGISMPNFPNFFMLYGPNTNLGHNSIIFMIECQVNYIVDAVNTLKKQGAKSLDLKAHKMGEFADYLKARLATSVWEKDCDSWYKNDAGKVTNNWPDFTYIYEEATKKVNLDDYNLSPAPNDPERQAAE
jgi:cation diffusion facilitator CzcD-associated flavoprotein CzcO